VPPSAGAHGEMSERSVHWVEGLRPGLHHIRWSLVPVASSESQASFSVQAGPAYSPPAYAAKFISKDTTTQGNWTKVSGPQVTKSN
jgi:hypothetical protein